MRTFLLALLSTFTAHAAPVLRVDVINTEIGVNDYQDRPTLCVLTVRAVEDGRLLGIVEDIGDCYWTRQARRYPEVALELPLHSLRPIETDEMRSHLQGFDSQLEFLWSSID